MANERETVCIFPQGNLLGNHRLAKGECQGRTSLHCNMEEKDVKLIAANNAAASQIPVYLQSAAYAVEHGELAEYRASTDANIACKDALETALHTHYKDNVLDTDSAVRETLAQFGAQRVQTILAMTVQRKEWDGRISPANKAWARTIPVPAMGQQDGSPSHSISGCKPSNLPRTAPKPPGNFRNRSADMAKRKRDVPVLFYVSKDEMELIQQKMQAFGTSNMSAYLRKMAIDGYVLKLDLPELKELVSLLRRWSNNLNQLTRRVHQTGRIYDANLQELHTQQDTIWDGVKQLLHQFAKLT